MMRRSRANSKQRPRRHPSLRLLFPDRTPRARAERANDPFGPKSTKPSQTWPGVEQFRPVWTEFGSTTMGRVVSRDVSHTCRGAARSELASARFGQGRFGFAAMLRCRWISADVCPNLLGADHNLTGFGRILDNADEMCNAFDQIWATRGGGTTCNYS